MKIVINTPAGNIGRVVTRELLLAGEELTLISRHPEKVQEFIKAGARLVRGSIDDPEVLDRAFAGADALFWLPPLVLDQPQFLDWARATGRAAAAVAARHHIAKCVVISSVGAQHGQGVGPIACMPAIEGALRAAIPHVVALRAGHFMENFLMHLQTIARDGAIYTPHPSELALPMVASRDIALEAVSWLRERSFEGFLVRGVHGPADLSHREAASVIGEALGRNVRHVEVPVEVARKGMLQGGMPSYVADLLSELYQGIRDGRVVRAEPRSPETTTRTTLAEFAREVLRPAFERRAA